MKHTLTLLIAFLLAPLATLHAADDIQWLVSYDAKALPDSTWTAIGKPNAKIENGTMRFVHSWKLAD